MAEELAAARAKSTTLEAQARAVAEECAWPEKPATTRLKQEQRRRIPLGTYDRLLREQGGVCAICGGFFERPLNIDHCHTTGVVRGLLCSPCNHGLGCFKDDLTRLARAMKYLITDRTGAPTVGSA